MIFHRNFIRLVKIEQNQIGFWFMKSGIILLVLGLGMLFPGRLAMSERLDPLVRAEVMISKGQVARALKLLTSLKTTGIDNWEIKKIILQRAICQKTLGQYENALAGFLAVEEDFKPLQGYLKFWQAVCLEGLGKFKSAVLYYNQVLKMEPPIFLRDLAALRVANLYLDGRLHSEASVIYLKLLDRSEQEVAALVGLARALEAGGDSSGSRKIRLRLIRDYPRCPEAIGVLQQIEPLKQGAEFFYGGVVYARNKKYQKAKALFKTVVRGFSGGNWCGRAQYELARVYYETKNYQTAKGAFEKAYRIYLIPKALFDQASCLVRLGEDLLAADRFQAFARAYPKMTEGAEALWNAGMAYERQKKPRQARKIYLELAKRYPKSSFADKGMWRAGFALYKMGDYRASIQSFLRLANQTPENYLRDQGFYWAGKCFQKLGKEKMAKFWTRKAAKGFPTSYYSSRAQEVLGLKSRVYPKFSEVDVNVKNSNYKPSDSILRGDFLASLGLYGLAEREYGRAEKVHRNNRYALNDILQRYERIRSMTCALHVSNLIVDLEQRQGVPMTLASFRRLYPIYYWGEVNRTAQEIGLDPNLILAIMRQESAFNESALSPVGARGLMQVMPSTGQMMARKISLERFSVADLWKPRTSIQLGGHHLSDHLRQFTQEKERKLGLALSAYNAGLKVAQRWSRQLSATDVDEFVESIPYRETRNYVKLVYRNYQVYSYLYREEPLAREFWQ